MFNHLLLVVNGPHSAARCTPWRSGLVGHPGGRITLLATLPDVAGCARIGARVIAYVDRQEDALRLGALAWLRAPAARLAARDFEVAILVKFGDAGDAILSAARSSKVDAIALATERGRRGLRVWRPSTTDAVLGRALVPILLARRTA